MERGRLARKVLKNADRRLAFQVKNKVMQLPQNRKIENIIDLFFRFSVTIAFVRR